MDAESMKPYGLALLDFFKGDISAELVIIRDDGLKDRFPISHFFRKPSEFSVLEQRALELCQGRVLDVGAGVGAHSLILQEKGLSVCAIDVCTEACEILRKRGIKDVRQVDIFEFIEKPFDTLLMLDHGLGIVGTVSGLEQFLEGIHRLVAKEGQILVDSMDIRHTTDQLHLAYQEANRQAGRYFGEVHTQFEYKGQKAPFFDFLNVSIDTLSKYTMKTGWSCTIIYKEESGDYLAQLTH
ncbi:MAG: class I SAM-dependent methyltransferase [Promethearchaeota archaeon]